MIISELKHFAETTTIHGLAGIINQKQPVWIRLAWLIAFLLVLGIYLFMLSTTLVHYFDYPVVTNVEYITTDSIAFPSVTICNGNLARYSAVVADDMALFVYQNAGPSNINLPEPSGPVNVSDMDIEPLNKEVSHQPSDMYLECAFDSQHQTPCNVSREVSWTMSPDGYCHTFNSQQLINMYGEKNTTRPGGKYGLDVLINIEEYDYFMPLTNASGIQVLVHDPHVLPDVREMGFVVAAGTETLVALTKTTVKRLPEPYAKSPNLCEDSYAPGYKNPLKYFSHYSLSACRRECRINNQLAICGCSAHIYGGDNVTVCSYAKFGGCTFGAAAQYDSDPSLEADCGCKPECEETLFDVTLSSTPMPNSNVKEELVAALNVPQINANNIDKNIISLKIFYGEMRYTVVEQQSVYTSTSLFGELGGQLGLCLGASFLTMMELVQLLGTMCILSGKRSAVSENKTVPC